MPTFGSASYKLNDYGTDDCREIVYTLTVLFGLKKKYINNNNLS